MFAPGQHGWQQCPVLNTLHPPPQAAVHQSSTGPTAPALTRTPARPATTAWWAPAPGSSWGSAATTAWWAPGISWGSAAASGAGSARTLLRRTDRTAWTRTNIISKLALCGWRVINQPIALWSKLGD